MSNITILIWATKTQTLKKLECNGTALLFSSIPTLFPKDQLVFVNRGQMSRLVKFPAVHSNVCWTPPYCATVLQSQTQNTPPHAYVWALCGYGLPWVQIVERGFSWVSWLWGPSTQLISENRGFVSLGKLWLTLQECAGPFYWFCWR